MKITKKIEKIVDATPYKLYISKRKYSEELAILKKKKLYSDVCWNENQEEEFNSFWKDNYGKVMRPWWNKMYEGFNGVYHYDYFPEVIYITELEPKLNPIEYCKYIEDKSFVDIIFGRVDEVKIPQTFVTCCNGIFRNADYELVSKESVFDFLKNIGNCVIKPTVDTGSGKGVEFFNFTDGVDTFSKENLKDTLKRYGKNFIVQQGVTNSDKLKALNPASLNTFRVISYIVDSEVKIAPITVRIGSGECKLDNIHSGGYAIGVNDDGTLKEYAYQLGYCNKSVKDKMHPNSKVVFKDYYIGDIDKVKEVAKKLHSIVPYVGIISWDLSLDENDDVILIEANCHDQGIWFPQIVNEKPLFGDDTAYMLRLLKKER